MCVERYGGRGGRRGGGHGRGRGMGNVPRREVVVVFLDKKIERE